MEELLNKWVYYPWLKNSNLDYLIHEEDLDKIDGLGIVECIDESKNFLSVRNNKGIFRVRKEGVKKNLPSPKFVWGEVVYEICKPEIKAVIEDFFWHQNKEQYLYYISVNGKKKSKRLSENELNNEPT